MNFPFLTKRQPSPPSIPAGPDTKPANSSAKPMAAAPAKSGSIASHFSLYGTKKGLAISHKNHTHINGTARAEIRAIDQEIQEASNHPDKEKSIAAILTKLLDKPFFQPPKYQSIPAEEIAKLFSNTFNDFPSVTSIGSKAETRRMAQQYSKKFIDGYARLEKKYLPNVKSTGLKSVERMIRQYIETKRPDESNFERELVNFLTNNAISKSRGSAQKMALETFIKAIPHTISNDKNHVGVLKKLIDTLPNLEHHEYIERSSQRRGLRVLEKALDNLPSNDAAEISAHLMHGITDLSKKLSKYKAAPNFKNCASLGMASSVFVALVGMAALATTPLHWGLAYVPAGGILAASVGAGMVGEGNILRKQQQGTAMYLLKSQLAKLRGDWNNITPENQQNLVNAFNELKINFHENKLEGTKVATLKRFFNDSFIDPSKFHSKPNQHAEMRKRFHHHFLAPITSRLKSVPRGNNS